MTSFTSHRFHALDGMRGIAAIAVMLSHYFVLSNGNTVLPAAYISVDFFFVLSGFVLQHSYGNKLLHGMRTGDYFARRIGRLLPTMVIGLLVGLAAALLSPDHTEPGMAGRYMESLLHSIAFLPYFSGHDLAEGDLSSLGLLFPLDSPLWSVSLEMLVSFAMVWLARLSARDLILICLAALGMILIGTIERGMDAGRFYFLSNVGWSNQNFMGGYPRILYGFTLGMLLYKRWQAGVLRRAALPAQNSAASGSGPMLLAYLVIAVMVSWQVLLKGSLYFAAILVVAPWLVLKGAGIQARHNGLNRLSEFLGWISYPLYCLHIPVLCLVTAIMHRQPLGAQHRSVMHPQAVALVLTLAGTILAGLALDRLQMQRRTTLLFQHGFARLRASIDAGLRRASGSHYTRRTT